jgi:hypothetical protein
MPLQGQTFISGKVQEGEGKPLPFANVLLLSAADSALVKGIVAGESGQYSLENVREGKYLLAASVVGYRKTFSPPFTVAGSSSRADQPPLVLEAEPHQLGEVTVVTKKPLFEQQMDRLVVNVQSSITAAGSTALEILERSPGITVNRQNNGLSMSGKDGVNVMINGKPVRVPITAVLQMLSGMQAANVEKIELITTPSAGYDAEGNAGVINIVLKKNGDYGTSGSVVLTMGYGAYEKPAAGFSFNHRGQKLSLYGEYSFLWNHFWQQFYNERQVRFNDQLTRTEGLSDRSPYQKNHSARLGADFTLSPRTTMSGMVSGFSNQFTINETNVTSIKTDGLLHTVIKANHLETNHWQHLMGNLNLRHTFTAGQEVNLDLDYLYYHNQNPHTYFNDFLLLAGKEPTQGQMTIGKTTPIRLWVGKADYTRTLSGNTKLETGLKATLSRLENDVAVSNLQEGEWVNDPGFSRQADMLEDIGAAYLNLNHPLNTRTKVQAGLRYEYTRTDLGTPEESDLIRRRYGYFFPSLFFSRDLWKGSSLQFSYGRRITRPTYNNLAPFVYFIDPSTFFSGNIALRPAITDALQTTWRFKDSYLLTLSYSYDSHTIIPWQVHVDPETNRQYARAENLRNSDTWSLTFSFPLRLTHWWQMQYSLLGVWQRNRTTYEGKPVELAAGYGRINFTQTFTLPAAFTLELTGFYQSRSPMGIAYMRAMGTFNAGLQKKLKGDAGTLRLTVDDLFWTMRFHMINNQPALQLDHRFRGLFSEPRVVRLTYSRNFGNKQLKGESRRNTGSEEERKRVN